MASIVVAGDTSGTVTLAAPAVSGTTTLTLPTTSGTVVTDATSTGINASALSTGTVPTARLASGTASSSTYLRGDQTWATVASGGLGIGQTWSSQTRSSGTTYTNSTGNPIAVCIAVQYGSNNDTTATVAGNQIMILGITSNYTIRWPLFFIVPNGATYSASAPAGFQSWYELR
jgi:hypothetical protein